MRNDKTFWEELMKSVGTILKMLYYMCWSYQELHGKLLKCFDTGNLYFPPHKTHFLPPSLKKISPTIALHLNPTCK